jgi:hypothetical protein
MSFDGHSLSEQTPDVSTNTSCDAGSLTIAELKDLTLDQFAKLCDITIEELVRAVSKHAEEIHHAAQLALSAPFVILLYAAYAGLANSTVKTHQENVDCKVQDKPEFLQQYDMWEKKLQDERHGSIYLNSKDRMRLCHALKSIASPGQDWSCEDHETLRDHILKVCPS